jgi:signal transduction histidine kinase
MMTFHAHAATRLMLASAELTDEWLRLLEEEAAVSARWYAPHAHELLRMSAHIILDSSLSSPDSPVAMRAMQQLGESYRDSGRTPAQLAWDFTLLARVLERASLSWAESYEGNVTAAEVAAITARAAAAPLQLCASAMLAYDERATATDNTRLMQFADAVAHELNTPLNAASVTAQLLEYAEGDMRSAEARRLAVLIRRNLQHADDVLQQLRQRLTAKRPDSRMSVPYDHAEEA